MPYIQNISDEAQLVRIQGEKKVLNPGEVAEVTESEVSITKSYKRFFQEVKTADGVTTPPATTQTPEGEKDPYEGLTNADLKKQAEDRLVDIKGLRKNTDIIAKLKEADAQEALAKTVVDENTTPPVTTQTPEGTETNLTPQA